MKNYSRKKRDGFFLAGLVLMTVGVTMFITSVVRMRNVQADEQIIEPIETKTEYIKVPVKVEVERKMTDAERLEDQREKAEYAASLDLLARCVMSEAGNQTLEVKRLVVDVILNRVDHPDFPDSISGVIYERTRETWQFSVVGNGAINTVSPDEDCFKAIEMELEERSNDFVLYFDSAGFLPYGTPFAQVGGLYFSGMR